MVLVWCLVVLADTQWNACVLMHRVVETGVHVLAVRLPPFFFFSGKLGHERTAGLLLPFTPIFTFSPLPPFPCLLSRTSTGFLHLLMCVYQYGPPSRRPRPLVRWNTLPLHRSLPLTLLHGPRRQPQLYPSLAPMGQNYPCVLTANPLLCLLFCRGS